jgi:cysteine desulfurase/selenocysteine lyase
MNLNVRSQFPVLSQTIEGKPVCYLDSAATAQKPAAVLDAMDQFYRTGYSSVKRGVYCLSERTTLAFEAARKKAAKFVGAAGENEIVFTRGTTESINLVAQSYGKAFFEDGDEVVLSALEHHANIVPWQIAGEGKNLKIRVIPCDDSGNLLLEALPALLSEKTKMVAVTHTANSIGTVNDIAKIVQIVRSHAPNAKVLVDAAQGISHAKIDARAWDCDFVAFSGHKAYGPTGVGVLYGKAALLAAMPPFLGGGEMIDQVTFEKTTFAAPPARFEAGTPPIAEVIGLSAAFDWMHGVGLEKIAAHERQILEFAQEELRKIPGLRLVGTPREQGALQSFVMEGVHAHDVSMILNEEMVALRSGHHCAQPVMARMGVPATLRASFAAYTEEWEVEALVRALQRVRRIFG